MDNFKNHFMREGTNRVLEQAIDFVRGLDYN